MDFLNQATAQVRELMLSMTPGARVTAFLLLGVIGVSLGYLVQHHSAGPDDFLFNGEFLPATDVDRAEALRQDSMAMSVWAIDSKFPAVKSRPTWPL